MLSDLGHSLRKMRLACLLPHTRSRQAGSERSRRLPRSVMRRMHCKLRPASLVMAPELAAALDSICGNALGQLLSRHAHPFRVFAKAQHACYVLSRMQLCADPQAITLSRDMLLRQDQTCFTNCASALCTDRTGNISPTIPSSIFGNPYSAAARTALHHAHGSA